MDTSQQLFLKQFLDVSKGGSNYIALDNLQVGVPYEITKFRSHNSVYGRCLIVDLAIGFWLVLPQRIGNLVTSEEQIELLNSKGYWLIFNGRNEQYRKMAMIEFKTIDQVAPDYFGIGNVEIEDMPLLQFTVDNTNSGTMLKEVGTQTDEIKTQEVAVQTEDLPQGSEQAIEKKTAAAPKTSIRVKKDKK